MDNNYYDFTSKEVLNNSTLIRNSGVPLAVSITPFIYEKDPSVPFFDTKLRSLCQCGQAIDNIDLNDEEYYCICDTHIDIDDDIRKMITQYRDSEVYEYITNSNVEDDKMYIVFVIDVNCSEGLHIVCDVIKEMKEKEKLMIGFVTYDVYEGICFYKSNKNGMISIMKMCDSKERFVPGYIKELMIRSDDKNIQIILGAIEDYISTRGNERDNGKFLIDAIEASNLLIKGKSGKLIVINSSMSWYNHNNMNTITKEEDNDELMNRIKKVSDDVVCQYHSIDIFHLQRKQNHKEEQQLKELSELTIETNGSLYYYRNFVYENDYCSIYNNIYSSFYNTIKTQKIQIIAFNTKLSHCLPSLHECTQQNLSVPEYYIPNIQYGQTLYFLLDLTDSKMPLSDILILCRVQYIDKEGRIRTREIKAKTSTTPSYDTFYKNINIELSAVVLTKLFALMIKTTKDISASIANINQLYFSKSLPAMKSTGLNDILNQFLLCFIGIMKHRSFCPDPIKYRLNSDIISIFFHKVTMGNTNEVMTMILPHIYDITNVLNGTDNFGNVFLSPIPLTSSSIIKDHIYLIDNGIFLDIHFTYGDNNEHKIKTFFGKDMSYQIVGTYHHTERSVLIDNVNCKNFEIVKIKEIIEEMRKKRRYYPEVFFSFEGSISDRALTECLIIDSNCEWFNFSYREYYNKL